MSARTTTYSIRRVGTASPFPSILALGPGLGRFGVALALIAAASLAGIAARPSLGEGYSALIFVVGISLAGACSGLVPSLVGALFAAVTFNLLVAEPLLIPRLTTGTDLAPPVIFTLCAIVSGVLAGRLRDESYRVNRANVQLAGLLETSRNLQQATDEVQVLDALKATVPGEPVIDLALYRLIDGTPVPVGDSSSAQEWTVLARRLGVEDAEFIRAFPLSGYLLTGSQGVVGALVNKEADNSGVDRAFMLAVAKVTGLALERAELARRIAEAQAVARMEEFKTALLSSVSHDLRTPLATISASTSSLIEFGDKFDAETLRELLTGIAEECDRLNHFTSNLLEMTRLQSGQAGLRVSALSASDIIRAVIARLKKVAAGRSIKFVSPARDILVEADTALFELALTNVLQNAIIYSEDGTTIRIYCNEDGRDCIISVTDQGVGIPAVDQKKVFDRFYRVGRIEASPRGSGLGLAIAKGFVEAFGGTIYVTSPVVEGRGTTVTISLPLLRGERSS